MTGVRQTINRRWLRMNIDKTIKNLWPRPNSIFFWSPIVVRRTKEGPTYISFNKHDKTVLINISEETVIDIMENSGELRVPVIVSYLLAHELGHVNILIQNILNDIDTSENNPELQNIAEDLEINWRSYIPDDIGIHARQFGLPEFLNWQEYYDLLSKEIGARQDPQHENHPLRVRGLPVGFNAQYRCGCNTQEIQKDLEQLKTTDLEKIKKCLESKSGIIQGKIINSNPIVRINRKQEVPKEWEDIIKRIMKHSRETMKVPHEIRPSYFRLNNRREDHDVFLPGDEFIEITEDSTDISPERRAVMFIDVSYSMECHKDKIQHVINACLKHRVGMVFYNTDIVGISNDVMKIDEIPEISGGTRFKDALEQYLETEPEPLHLYVITDGFDNQLQKYLNQNPTKITAWRIDEKGLPERIMI